MVFSYSEIQLIGTGAFGNIYQCKLANPRGPILSKIPLSLVAVKSESPTVPYSHLFREGKIYQYLYRESEARGLGKPTGVGAIYGAKQCEFNGKMQNTMAMELLGPSIQQLFNRSKCQFTLQTILMVADQMLTRIQFLHSMRLLHRDVKPDNFVISPWKDDRTIYIIDFGLTKKYASREGVHIPYRTNKSLTGTVRFTSINIHMGSEHGRRDDLESLAYTLIYLAKGSLPWQSLDVKDKEEKHGAILEMKLKISPEELCKGLAEEFSLFLKYSRNLGFDEAPDYNYLRGLLCQLFKRNHCLYDAPYDWFKSPSFSLPPPPSSSSLMPDKNLMLQT